MSDPYSLSHDNYQRIQQVLGFAKEIVDLKGVNSHGGHVTIADHVASHFNLSDSNQIAHIIAWLLTDNIALGE